jgi:hypothetical protein
MTLTPNLNLPYIIAAQAQKHVTHNEAIRTLDALVQLTVLSRAVAAPPASPLDGARYLVAAAATGAWIGQSGKIAAFQDNSWSFFTPLEGWTAWVADEDKLIAYDGAGWVMAGGGGGTASVNPTPLIGVNTTADTTNRLAVSSPATLFNHAGAGHQLKLNKATSADTVSVLYQAGFSGRAEMGLTGDDNFHVKVSADGTTWREAIVIDRASGVVTLPLTPAVTATASAGVNPNLLINGDFQINQRVFTGGALAAGSYGHDRWKADTGGASYAVTTAAYTVTLASGALAQIIESEWMAGQPLAAQTVTVSIDSPSADMTITLGSGTGTITAGTGRRSLSLTLAAGDTGNLAFKIARAAAGSVTFGRVKVEVGAAATGWQPRPRAQEKALAERYYQKSYQDGIGPGVATSAGALSQYGATTTVWLPVRLGVRMRTSPAVTVYSSGTGTVAKLYDTTAGDLGVSVVQIGEQGFVVYGGGSSNAFQYAQFTAAAEL